MKLRALALLTGAIGCGLTPAFAVGVPIIAQAYEDEGHRLLIEMKPDPALLASGSVYFHGDRKSIQQIDMMWASHDTGQTLVEFKSGEIKMGPLDANLICDSTQSHFNRLDQSALRGLNQRAQSRDLSISYLPKVMEPRYFYQIEGKDEYVLVKSARYDFKGEYEVWMGKAGKLRRLDTKPSTKVGVIPLAQGGGLFLPIEINLFKSTEGKGSPMLVLSHPSRVLNLIDLSGSSRTRERWIRALLKSPEVPQVKPPCGPPAPPRPR